MNLGIPLALGFIGIALVCLAFVWRGTTELIHPPHRRAETTPAHYQLEFENISFTARDGLTLRGWFIPASNPRGTIILCHGYIGDCSPDLEYAPMFHQHGFHTLYFDFRGHGMSDGNYTSIGFFERRDLLAAIDFLRARDIRRVGLFGLSMGGAIALSTAPLSASIIGVLSDSTFAELWHVVRHGARKRGIPAGLAGVIAWLVIAMASLRLRANLFSADPIHSVGRITPRPLLLMHGVNDDAVPLAESRALYTAARDPKEWWTVPNAAHREIEKIVPEDYRERVIAFFDQLFCCE